MRFKIKLLFAKNTQHITHSKWAVSAKAQGQATISAVKTLNAVLVKQPISKCEQGNCEQGRSNTY
jgi:hypothetical protein